ncbi:hypothetical protein [Spiroplasma endosymbiont of Lasioglossum villosulum]|uniref:hypothetical protein n=1 Tax=Spiroplasma endosymbiont of Lasioglossum villosulum TaxID=3066320 RepID=UPI0030D59253
MTWLEVEKAIADLDERQKDETNFILVDSNYHPEMTKKKYKYWKKFKTKHSTAAKTLKIISASTKELVKGGYEGIPEGAVRGTIIGAGAILVTSFFVSPPAGIIVAGTAVAGGVTYAVVKGSHVAIIKGKAAAKKFDEKKKVQKQDLEEAQKHAINFNTIYKIKQKLNQKNQLIYRIGNF